MSSTDLSFTLNGKTVEVAIDPSTLLVDLLRDYFGLTGTKVGCREGECGACTVSGGRTGIQLMLDAGN